MAGRLIAILRGLSPEHAVDVTQTIIENGIDWIEVPLNSPDALSSIALMAKHFSATASIGAGTVLQAEQVDQVREAGGQFIVSPNCRRAVIERTVLQGMKSFPGVFSPSECFDALDWGAHALKLFPASVMGPSGVQALRAVLPSSTRLFVVGGVDAENLPQWAAAGAQGFGIGSSLYKPGKELDAIAADTRAFVAALAAV